MIQRLQSLYLFVAAVAMSMMFAFNMLSFGTDDAWVDLRVSLWGASYELSDDAVDKMAERELQNAPEGHKEEIMKHYEGEIERTKKELDRYFHKEAKEKYGAIFTVAQIGIGILTLAIVGLIFMFKNLKRQLFYGRLLFLLLLLAFGGILIGADFGASALERTFKGELMEWGNLDVGAMETAYDVATFMPIVAAAFVFLANLRIKHDYKLLKSVDRLR